MKHIVIELEGKNELINFSHKTLGNCFLEANHGYDVAQPSSFQTNEQFELLDYTWTSESDCKIVEIYHFFFTNSIVGTDIWTLFFDGSRSQEGARVGCILIDHKKHKTLISYHLEFKCTNNTVEYKTLVQALKKDIELKVRSLRVFGVS
jgi:hypothetical protein